MLVVSVFETPGGTVMVGCEPLQSPEDQPIHIPSAEVVRFS